MSTKAQPKTPITAADICIITPTKGRHKQLDCLLTTLAAQTQPVGKIIIADGGGDAEALIASHQDKLPVIWLDCPQPGQILQRNYALQHLPGFARIIIYFDDDIQLTPDAVAILLAFWNAQDKAPAGVSFNITNMPKQPDNMFRHIFVMASEPRGRVWKSGYNSPVTGVKQDIQSQWLIGGATAWRRDVLENRTNEGIPSRWAITEDLMFSYPVSKSGNDLYVCAAAKVLHIDNTPTETFKAGIFRGNSAVLWRYLFVTSHSELSGIAMVWMILGQIAGRIVQGLRGRGWNFGYALGYAKGLSICALSKLTRRDIREFFD